MGGSKGREGGNKRRYGRSDDPRDEASRSGGREGGLSKGVEGGG